MSKIEQDYLRRIVLWEHDKPGGLAPALIEHTVRFALDNGRDVILEGILHTARYRDMIASLWRAHRGRTSLFYLDETLRRHTTRPQVSQFSADDIRGWYAPGELLDLPGEQVIPEPSSMEDSIAVIAATAGIRLAATASA